MRQLAEHLAPAVGASFSLRLWNGEIVPLGPNAKSDLAVAVRSPVAITRLLRRPRLATLVELIAEGQLDIEGGTLLDLARRRKPRSCPAARQAAAGQDIAAVPVRAGPAPSRNGSGLS